MMNEQHFQALGVSEPLLRSLAQMQLTIPTPVQAKAIPAFYEGRDLLVQAPTGTGKTCAFGIPLIEKIEPAQRMAQALILSPTRELALQTADVLTQLCQNKPGIRIVCVYGGENIERQMKALRGRPQIIVATPGRLIDHMQRGTVKLFSLHTVILDEADRMLDMGFRPDLNRILSEVPQQRQTALYSATLNKEVLDIAKKYQHNASKIAIEQDAQTVDTVLQYYAEIPPGAKNEAILRLLHAKQFPLCLVFTNAKHRADRLCRLLKKKGYSAAALHGDIAQTKRERVMQQYRNGEIQVLVATDVASRGIDVHNIDVVINYDMPKDDDSYVHRIGRTGRANQKGVAYTFLYPDEHERLRKLRRNTNAQIARAQESCFENLYASEANALLPSNPHGEGFYRHEGRRTEKHSIAGNSETSSPRRKEEVRKQPRSNAATQRKAPAGNARGGRNARGSEDLLPQGHFVNGEFIERAQRPNAASRNGGQIHRGQPLHGEPHHGEPRHGEPQTQSKTRAYAKQQAPQRTRRGPAPDTGRKNARD